jgi:hypothetical protein
MHPVPMDIPPNNSSGDDHDDRVWEGVDRGARAGQLPVRPLELSGAGEQRALKILAAALQVLAAHESYFQRHVIRAEWSPRYAI